MKRSNVISFAVTLLAFGVLVPFWKGLDFFDPVFIAVAACIPLVFVAPLCTQSGALRSTRDTLFLATGYSAALSALILANGVLTVNIQHAFGHVVHPSWLLVLAMVVMNTAASLFIAMLTVWVAARTNPDRARGLVRTIFFVLLFLFVYLSRLASPGIRSAFDEQMTTDALTRNAAIAAFFLFAGAAAIWFGFRRQLTTGDDRRQPLNTAP